MRLTFETFPHRSFFHLFGVCRDTFSIVFLVLVLHFFEVDICLM